MAKFCRNCGSPLVDGKCLQCNQRTSNNRYQNEHRNRNTSRGVVNRGNAQRNIPSQYSKYLNDLRIAVKQNNTINILSVLGISIIGILSLLQIASNFYGRHIVGISITYQFASILISLKAIEYWKTPKNERVLDLELGICNIMFVFSILNIISLISRFGAPYFNYESFVIVGLLFNSWHEEKNSIWRNVYLIGIVAIIVSLFINTFSYSLYQLTSFIGFIGIVILDIAYIRKLNFK